MRVARGCGYPLDMDAPRGKRNAQAGWTALMWGAEQGCKEVVRVLVDRGADVNFKDEVSQIARHLLRRAGGL